MSVSASALNTLFRTQVSNPEGLQKVAGAAGEFVRLRMRELSFARKILPPKNVTKDECQVSVNHDTLVYIDEVEPESQAMSLTFRGTPRPRYISAPRYEIPFFMVSSEKFEKTTQELAAYKMAITKIIEKNSVSDMHTVQDHRFIYHVEQCVQTTGQIVKGQDAQDDIADNGTEAAVYDKSAGHFLGKIKKTDFINLCNLIDGEYKKLSRILIGETDWNDIMNWTIEDFGDEMASKVLIEGMNYDKILGRLVVRTIKQDLIIKGNIYGFTTPGFLGKFLLLNSVEFFLKKEANLISWQCWEDIGMGFGNINGIAKLELYNAASNAIPAEKTIGTGYHDNINDGVVFPKIVGA